MITFRKLGKLGRFGNQLFQYAGTRLYAEHNGFTWKMPRWIGEDIFQMTNDEWRMTNMVGSFFIPTIQLEDIKSTSWSERLLRPVGLWRRSSIEELYRQPEDNINIYGYLQDQFSLQKIAENKERVRKWFTFKKEIDDAFRTATRKYQPWIGVHIRRGDLVKRGLAVPIERYLEILPGLVGQRNIFVASDDPAVMEEFASFCPFVIRHSDFDIPPWAVDFWLLVNAQTILGCGSTFSWWAAYLGNKNSYYSPPLTHVWPDGYKPRLDRVEI